MLKVNHSQFVQAFTRQMQGAYQGNQDQETIILGAIQLYWKHSKNISYLNDALQYARGRKGIRVNAVRAFLETFSGAVYKGDKFTGAGRSTKECPENFHDLESWLEWANEKAQEPEYSLPKQQLKVISFLQHQKKTAIEHGQHDMAEMLTKTIVEYVEANKKVVQAA